MVAESLDTLVRTCPEWRHRSQPAHRYLTSGEPLVVRGPQLYSGDSETVSTAQVNTVVYSANTACVLVRISRFGRISCIVEFNYVKCFSRRQ